MSSRALAACCLVAALAGCGGDSGNGESAAPQPGPSASPLEPSRTAPLDGAQAARTQFTYKWKGRSIIQSNLVAIANGVVVFIEVDAEPSDEREAQRVLETVIENWRWSESTAVVPS